MLCFKCSLKNECKVLCEGINDYLKETANGKTTYRNHEVELSEKVLNKHEGKYSDSFIETGITTYEKKYLGDIIEIIHSELTNKQRRIMILYLEGHSSTVIAESIGTTRQAVYYALNGHPNHGGGIIRKIQKKLNISS